MKKLWTYENGLLSLLCITFGLVFVDRFAFIYLTPYISSDLNLNNTQIGILVSALSLSWAASGYFTTGWAEARNKKKPVFILVTILFSICSISSGLATGFWILLTARLMMGVFEGPTLPLIQSFLAKESTPSRLGFNMGALQSFGSTLFGMILAPVVLVAMAERLGWRSTFYIAGIPGLIMAFLGWLFIKPSTAISLEKTEDSSLSFGELWKYKNVRVATILSCLGLAWLNSCLTFMPEFFVKVHHIETGNIGNIMGLMGLSSFLSGIMVTALSDRMGRKKVISFFLLIGVFYPLSILLLGGSSLQLVAMFLAFFMFGTFPIIFAAIPFQTVPRHSVGKAIGLIVGVGEIVGGVIIPFLDGVLADTWGLTMPFWVSTLSATLAFLISFSLIEPKRA